MATREKSDSLLAIRLPTPQGLTIVRHPVRSKKALSVASEAKTQYYPIACRLVLSADTGSCQGFSSGCHQKATMHVFRSTMPESGTKLRCCSHADVLSTSLPQSSVENWENIYQIKKQPILNTKLISYFSGEATIRMSNESRGRLCVREENQKKPNQTGSC